MPPERVFFTDRDLGRHKLPNLLKQAGLQVEVHHDHFKPDAADVDWLPEEGTLVQYAGRLHRQHHRKTEIRIYDYVDGAVPMLARMFEKRLRGYRAMGYRRTELPERIHSARDPVIEYDAEAVRSDGMRPL